MILYNIFNLNLILNCGIDKSLNFKQNCKIVRTIEQIHKIVWSFFLNYSLYHLFNFWVNGLSLNKI